MIPELIGVGILAAAMLLAVIGGALVDWLQRGRG
jgi:hypothetical protein